MKPYKKSATPINIETINFEMLTKKGYRTAKMNEAVALILTSDEGLRGKEKETNPFKTGFVSLGGGRAKAVEPFEGGFGEVP